MTTVAQDRIRWRKSSRSQDEGACVEVAHTMAGVRDSKYPDGPALAFGDVAAVRALMVALRRGLGELEAAAALGGLRDLD